MSDTVHKPTKAVEAMRMACEKGRALMGGTTAMRSAGEKYLPKFSAEEEMDYRARLNMSWLFNGYLKTVRDMSGRVFEEPVKILTENATLATWAENIDLEGNDLSRFAGEVFKDGLSGCGISYILAEAPPREGDMTRGQAAALGIRPYLVHLKVEDILGWRAESVSGVMVLTMLRIMETVTEPDPEDEFSDIEVEQVRVYTLNRSETSQYVSVRLYRKDNKGKKWVLFDEYDTEMDEIMLAPFYANRTGFMTGGPLLDDLADVNIAHWQSQSDQRTILHAVRTPVLFITGYDDQGGEAPLVISSSKAIVTTNTEADAKWVEHGGQAIGDGRTDLKDLEFQMQAFGLQLVVARRSGDSATAATLDAKKETSILAMIADNLQDTLELALGWMADLGGLGLSSVEVEVCKKFTEDEITVEELALMQRDVVAGLLSKEAYYDARRKAGLIGENVTAEDDQERVMSEGAGLGGDTLEGGADDR